MAPIGDPPRCRCGQYHIVETYNAVVTVPCPYGWDALPYSYATISHCPGCRCDERKEDDGSLQGEG